MVSWSSGSWLLGIKLLVPGCAGIQGPVAPSTWDCELGRSGAEGFWDDGIKCWAKVHWWGPRIHPQGVQTASSTQAAWSRTSELSAEDLSEDNGFSIADEGECIFLSASGGWAAWCEGAAEGCLMQWSEWVIGVNLFSYLQYKIFNSSKSGRLSGACEGSHNPGHCYVM